MQVTGRRQALAPSTCAAWALLALLGLSLWQAAKLRRGPSAGPWPATVGAGPLLHPQAAVLPLLPAESPLAVVPGKEPGLGLGPGRLPGAAAWGRLNFPAEGPLDSALGSWRAGARAPARGSGPGAEALGGEAGCEEVHPNADSPGMLHVAFAADASQLEGVQASVASVVASAASPEELTVHLMVQKRWAQTFKERFGVQPECQAMVTVTGVLIRVHAVDAQLIEKAVAKVSKAVRKERGAIDTIENFARFYMHLVFDFDVAIYLDADTIVQADLGQLRRQLLASNKTVGFVARDSPVSMGQFLRFPKSCSIHPGRWKRLMKLPAYNVGVFAVNLQRWREQRAVDRVQALVAQHNSCGGTLWVGGSQPPLLLAFLDRPEGEPPDFVVFHAAWNAGDLGWRTGFAASKLRRKFVLHWNGHRKPWQHDGLYRELWLPHRQAFAALLRPYVAGPARAPGLAGAAAPATAPAATVAPATVPGCPGLALLATWPDAAPCRPGETFGCAGRGIWTRAGCAGLFNATGAITACGSASEASCPPGAMPAPSSPCGLMILTSYFTTKKDWQRGRYAKASFSKIQKLYQTAIRSGVNVTVIYDTLPDDLVKRYACDRFRFEHVDLSDFDRRYGVNDVRYFFFERLVREHPEWDAVFIVDAFDVRVGLNPCPRLADGTLYVGHEQDRLRRHPWMNARFKKMGGKYNEWYKTKVTDKMKILNCGITGGRRSVMIELLHRMTEVLLDPAIVVSKKKKEDINLNMASLNYVVYNDFAGRFAGNAPVHSVYKRFETKRRDVWFIHK